MLIRKKQLGQPEDYERYEERMTSYNEWREKHTVKEV
jgi:hypothetical protein